ncbi:MAG: hypothetical protein L6R35_003276, partial [Caloplaca aegaea]
MAQLDLMTSIPYLARSPVYEREKPYQMDHTVHRPDGIGFANHELERHPITVLDIRNRQKPSIERNGFCIVKANTTLSADQASNARTPAMSKYLDEIERLLYREFPEYSRIEVLDWGIRKRSPDYPAKIDNDAVFEQPAALPHSDFSTRGAFLHLSEAFPGQEKHFADKDYDLINVWRVLVGPNNDWPLAMLDFQSVNIKNDVLPNDCLHYSSVGENQILHSSKDHKWYYLSAQEETELLLFRNADSKGARACAYHAAVENTLNTGPPRQSIE